MSRWRFLRGVVSGIYGALSIRVARCRAETTGRDDRPIVENPNLHIRVRYIAHMPLCRFRADEGIHTLKWMLIKTSEFISDVGGGRYRS